MKRIQLLALGALLSLAGQVAYPYAIMNSKNSSDAAFIYIFKDQDKYLKMLKARGVPDEVLKYADKIATAAPAIGAALAAPTEGASLLVAEAFPISVKAAKLIVKVLQDTGLMDAGIRRLAGVVAVHRGKEIRSGVFEGVLPGNEGRGAEWNWADIQKEYSDIKQGDSMYVVVTDKENGVPVLQTTIASNGLLGFVIKKDAKGQYYAEQSSAAIGEYRPATETEKEESIFDTIKKTFSDLVQ